MLIRYKSIVTGPITNLFSYAGWPSVCADEEDRLYAVCSGHRMGHICPFGQTFLYKSSDLGKTWSVPRVVDDSWFDDRDAGILYLGRGKMLVTNFKHPVEVYEQHYRNSIRAAAGQLGDDMIALCRTLGDEEQKGGSFYKVSDDYGETWGPKERIPVNAPHGPILLRDGHILYVGKEHYSYGEEEDGTINVYLSEPDPIAFRKISRCPKPSEYGWEKFHEPHCAELDSGRLLTIYRSHIDEDHRNFTMYTTFSDDHGLSWSDPQATGICGSPPHLAKLRDGRMILSYGRRIAPFGIYARVVDRDGTIGTEELLIDETADLDIGYPATVELQNGDLVTVFYKREISDRYASIVSVRWSL